MEYNENEFYQSKEEEIIESLSYDFGNELMEKDDEILDLSSRSQLR